MRFILFDDDPVNNTLCQLAIKNALKEAEVITFTLAEKGFQYISTEKMDEKSIVMLDINMQDMTCWEFLHRFEKFDEHIKDKFNLFILSASLSPDDKTRALLNKNVKEFIEKPLTSDKVLKILSLL
jgi:response regulator RpfG family c-di-GMP phosphodiesterase